MTNVVKLRGLYFYGPPAVIESNALTQTA